jgi:Fic family protein
MGSYVERYWISDASGMNKAERMGGAYRSYVPDALEGFELMMEPSCAAAVTRASEALRALEDAGSLTDTEPLARLLLRAEAVSSSRIEGLEVPAGKLLEYEELDRLSVEHRLDSTEAQVLGNLHALVDGLAAVGPGYAFTVGGICELNRELLAGTRIADAGGVLRRAQNWIGGNRVNPVGAAYVPPEPELVPGLMEDLAAFLNTTELPPVAAAAIAHAQLETIHPFADGNGRAGRALVHVVLKAAGLARATVPPVSLVLATDRERYVANLAAYRTDGDAGEERNGAVNGWVEYFANAMSLSCERAAGFEARLAEIREGWLARTGFRAGSAGRLLIDLLPGTPALSIRTAQKLTGRSYPAVRTAVLALVEADILHQSSKNRKSGIYVAREVVDAFNAYERALATTSGDASAEKPRRHVPQRPRRS